MTAAGRMYVSRPVGPSPASASKSVSRSMRSNRGSGTKPELVLAKLLRRKVVHSTLPGSPDFVYRGAKLAVFVHGCFWHRCPIHARALPRTNTEFWRRKFERNVERDKLNRQELKRMGWNVMEVWEHEVKENPVGVKQRIVSFLAGLH